MCLQTCDVCVWQSYKQVRHAATPPPVTVIFVVKTVLWFQHLVPFQNKHQI